MKTTCRFERYLKTARWIIARYTHNGVFVAQQGEFMSIGAALVYAAWRRHILEIPKA